MGKIIVDIIPPKEPKSAIAYKTDILCHAIYEMYTFLDKEGILSKVSFKYEKTRTTEVTVHFALNSDDLLPYKKLMEFSSVNAALAIEKIFCDSSPCWYCGGVSLLYPMRTFRDSLDGYSGGCVSKSWECVRCSNRWSYRANRVEKYKKNHSAEETILKFWNDFGQPPIFSKFYETKVSERFKNKLLLKAVYPDTLDCEDCEDNQMKYICFRALTENLVPNNTNGETVLQCGDKVYFISKVDSGTAIYLTNYSDIFDVEFEYTQMR